MTTSDFLQDASKVELIKFIQRFLNLEMLNQEIAVSANSVASDNARNPSELALIHSDTPLFIGVSECVCESVG